MALHVKDFSASHLKRYRDIAWLLARHGRSDLVRQAGLQQLLVETTRQQSSSENGQAEAITLADDLERLGPTFVKLGQILSARADMLPFTYLDALSRLQDQVEPFDYADVERIVREELGTKLEKVFQSFDTKPVAAASLGQVHRAVLHDGRPVAVKVQRPNVRQQIALDLEVLEQIAELLDTHTKVGRKYEFARLLDDARRSLIRELDYRREAGNMLMLADNLKEYPNIVMPRPVEDYTTGRLLTMDYISGRKITEISPLTYCEIDGQELLDELFRAYLHQILVLGFFHADPHPGNVFLTDDRKIALLDLGMIGTVSPARRESVTKILMTVSQGRGEEAADAILAISEVKPGFQREGFRSGISELVMTTLERNPDGLQFGPIVMSFQRVAAENAVRVPHELRMIGKTLLNLESVKNVLHKEFDPNAAIRRHTASIMERRLLHSLAPNELLRNVAELKEFVEKLPVRMNMIMDRLANNELEVHVDAIDENRLMVGFQKVANRITVGLVLAAMIVGAALLMRVETSFTLLGYPGFAMIMFLFAATLGTYMVLNILWSDIKDDKHKRP